MAILLSVALMLFATAEFQTAQQQRVVVPPSEEFLSNRPSSLPTSLEGVEYRIGRDDLIEIAVFEVPDLGRTDRVNASGIVSLPLIGPIEASGKTTRQLERLIEEALKKSYINDPHVTVFIREYASQPVSILGAVRAPGMYQLKGQKFLLDMLSQAQGLDLNHGNEIQIIRRSEKPDEKPRAIMIDAEELLQNGKTELNIPIQANDVINVLRAGSVFVVGEVTRSGEFTLRNGRNVTVTQAVALGSGFSKDAKRKECVIIRLHKDGTKEEIPVNVEKILDGSLNDVTMMPEDILFVPANRVRAGLMRTLDATIGIVSGRLIYRF